MCVVSRAVAPSARLPLVHRATSEAVSSAVRVHCSMGGQAHVVVAGRGQVVPVQQEPGVEEIYQRVEESRREGHGHGGIAGFGERSEAGGEVLVEGGQAGRGDYGGGQGLVEGVIGAHDVDDGEERGGQGVGAAGHEHAALVDVVVVHAGGERDVAVGVVDPDGAAELDG